MTSITKLVRKKLFPVRVITVSDTIEDKYFVLSTKLSRSDFNLPILEKYSGGTTFYGFYDLTRNSSGFLNRKFLKHAAGFFESVARTLPHTTPEDDSQEVYSQYENRKRVASHLRRERSRLLASARKILDDYECQVCGFRFREVYGKLGIEFAEAHHLVPLNQLRENIKTRVEDLATVCANCHRMLHRMEGSRDDIGKLRAIVRKRR